MKKLLVIILLLILSNLIASQLTIGQITNITCPFSPSPTNTINLTFSIPSFVDDYVVLHFHGDVPFYNAYAVFPSIFNPILTMSSDSVSAATGGELWLYGQENYTVVVNCSQYSTSVQFTIEPVIPQSIPDAYGGFSTMLVNDPQSGIPHSHWFSFSDCSILKVELCSSAYAYAHPIAVRVVFEPHCWDNQDTGICGKNGYFNFKLDEQCNFLGFSNSSSLVVSWDLFSTSGYVFVGSVDAQRNLLPINYQLIFAIYFSGFQYNYMLYGVQAYKSLFIGSWNDGNTYLPSEVDHMNMYVFNKSLGFANSACLISREGILFEGTISNLSSQVDFSGWISIITVEDFFKKFGNVDDYYGALVVGDIAAWPVHLDVYQANMASDLNFYLVVGLGIFCVICTIALTVLCFKTRKARTSGYVGIN